MKKMRKLLNRARRECCLAHLVEMIERLERSTEYRASRGSLAYSVQHVIASLTIHPSTKSPNSPQMIENPICSRRKTNAQEKRKSQSCPRPSLGWINFITSDSFIALMSALVPWLSMPIWLIRHRNEWELIRSLSKATQAKSCNFIYDLDGGKSSQTSCRVSAQPSASLLLKFH